MEKKTLGLYLHIPFCRSKCLYCDFYSIPRPSEDLMRRYSTAMQRDLAARSAQCGDYTVDTVYFGGGTPTLLPEGELEAILSAVAAHYHLAPDAEITAECNPATVTRERLLSWRRAGLDRLSIGLQSIHPKELKALGRLHSFSDFITVYNDARDAGFDNLSVDLMSGIPGQSLADYLATVDAVAALGPEHISAYGLIVEEGTPFGNMGERLTLPDEEDAREMFFSGIQALEGYGLLQYEISNFARPGYESRHNLKYWSCDPYIGFGPAAYSDFLSVRSGNSRDALAYIEGRDIECEREIPSENDRMCEYVMLRLRLTKGIDVGTFRSRFGADFEEMFGKKLSRYLPMGLLRRTPAGYALTPEGMYVSNSILSDILDFDVSP